MPEQHRLDVLRPERLAKQGIVTEIELAYRQIIGCAPVGVYLADQFG
jgi:chromosome condensin MukBEF MukE localization factor